MPPSSSIAQQNIRANSRNIFLAFLKLGLTSFGGPIAHIGYFRTEFVTRRNWLSENQYGEIVALCQFLPGPTSSQVGFLIGLMRGGPLGAFLAWLAFTAPSAISMALSAYGLLTLNSPAGLSFLHGLKLVAVVIVAQALWGMSRTLTPNRTRISIAVLSFALIALSGQPLFQLAAIASGGLLGLALCRDASIVPHSNLIVPVSRRVGLTAWAVFILLLFGLPVLAVAAPGFDVAHKFFQSGALVFGGGHVILPLLEQEFVASGLIDKDTFLVGYGAAQAMPGPLFNFASYLGVLAHDGPRGVAGAFFATVAIFLPGFLILLGVLPFWNSLRHSGSARAAITGANASVVGVLGAALYQPIWTSSVSRLSDFALVVIGYILLVPWRLPSWVIVLMLPIASALLVEAGY